MIPGPVFWIGIAVIIGWIWLPEDVDYFEEFVKWFRENSL